MAAEEAAYEENEPAYTATINTGTEVAQMTAQHDRQIRALQVKIQEAENVINRLKKGLIIEEPENGTSRNTTKEPEPVRPVTPRVRIPYRETATYHSGPEVISGTHRHDNEPMVVMSQKQVRELVRSTVDESIDYKIDDRLTA